MARSESDREDLLREATALVERAELQVVGEADPVVVGFRRNGAASCFFGADPVYQFNTAGELRRAYIAGRLLKAESGRLVALSRERSATEVALIRTELTSADQVELLHAAQLSLRDLTAALSTGHFQLLGQVPPTGDILSRIQQWLASLPADLTVAAVPNVH